MAPRTFLTSHQDREDEHALLEEARPREATVCRYGAAAAAASSVGRRSAVVRAGALLVVVGAAAASYKACRWLSLSSRPASPPSARSSDLQLTVADEEKSRCLDALALNDFSSPASMMASGWMFRPRGPGFRFQPDDFESYIAPTSFWGYSAAGNARVFLLMKGSGVVTVDFGNFDSKEESRVVVSLDGQPRSSAGPFTISQHVSIHFYDGDELSIAEAPHGVIVINKIVIECAHERKPQAMRREKVHSVEEDAEEFKHEFKKKELSNLEKNREKEELHHVEDLEHSEEEEVKKESETAEKEARKIEVALKANKTRQAEEETRRKIEAMEKQEKAEEIKEKLEEQRRKAKKELAREDEEIKDAQMKSEEAAKTLGKSLKHQKDHANSTVHAKNSTAEANHTNETAEDLGPLPTLYCWALMLPFGYEPMLLKTQRDRGVGLFNCDKTQIFTNSSKMLDKKHKGDPIPMEDMVHLLDFSLAVPFGGRWNTALNTDVFVKLWVIVVKMGDYNKYDWTVKADPDTVFFPQRLRAGLRERRERMTKDKTSHQGCGTCKHLRFKGDDCAWHVRYLQNRGKTCEEALDQVRQEPPIDCGCECTAKEACHWPPQKDGLATANDSPDPEAIYINNCKYGLHGPIEVMNRHAVTLYVNNIDSCHNLPADRWGEDKWMDRCFLQLGVMRVNWFSLLSETACHETPAPCITQDIAYHPFKTVDEYFACESSSRAFGDMSVAV